MPTDVHLYPSINQFTMMMVALSVPISIFNPNPMYLPLPLAVLYLTYPAVTKLTRTSMR